MVESFIINWLVTAVSSLPKWKKKKMLACMRSLCTWAELL